MAWYHVGGCDCPVGCCDCGSKESTLTLSQRRRKTMTDNLGRFLDDIEKTEKEHQAMKKIAQDRYHKEYDKSRKDLDKMKKDAEKEAQGIIKAAHQKAGNIPELLKKLKKLMTSKVNKNERRHIYRIWSEMDEKEFYQWLKDGDF
jgi:tRNA uridine 5-carbamoylmethylation protein Kti12